MQSSLKNRRWNRVTAWIAGLAILLGVLQSSLLVASQTSEPHTNLSYQVATYIEASATANDKLLIVARPFTPDDWNYFLQKASSSKGKRALRLRTEFCGKVICLQWIFKGLRSKPACHRIAFVSSADLATVNWLLIWNDRPRCLTLWAER